MTKDLERTTANFDIADPEQKEAWLQQRVKVLTSTDVSALFGQNPYKTKYELWIEKASKEPQRLTESERMKWGSRLEAAIAKGAAEDYGWNVRAWNAFMTVPDLGVGSSFDYRILQSEGQPKAVLEIKAVDGWVFRKDWEELPSGKLVPPPHIEWQVQAEMLVSRYDEAYLIALVGGNNVQCIHFDADPEMQGAIVREAEKFWESIEDGEMPDPVYTEDLRALSKQYQYTNPNDYTGPQIDRLVTLATAHCDRKERVKIYDADLDTIKAEVLDILRDCDGAVLPGFKKFSCKTNKKGVRSLLVTREEESNVE